MHPLLGAPPEPDAPPVAAPALPALAAGLPPLPAPPICPPPLGDPPVEPPAGGAPPVWAVVPPPPEVPCTPFGDCAPALPGAPAMVWPPEAVFPPALPPLLSPPPQPAAVMSSVSIRPPPEKAKRAQVSRRAMTRSVSEETHGTPCPRQSFSSYPTAQRREKFALRGASPTRRGTDCATRLKATETAYNWESGSQADPRPINGQVSHPLFAKRSFSSASRVTRPELRASSACSGQCALPRVGPSAAHDALLRAITSGVEGPGATPAGVTKRAAQHPKHASTAAVLHAHGARAAMGSCHKPRAGPAGRMSAWHPRS